MVIGAAIGAFNGFFVAKFKLHPFIVTLATQLIIYTLLLLYVKAGNNNGMAISGLDASYSNFITGCPDFIKNLTGGVAIPNYVWLSLLLTAVMWFIWNKTTFGKNMFALGANEEAARVSGVNVFATNIMVFALAGSMYAVTGFIEGARVASNTANTGLNYESDAIAACVIGGVSFVGGIGKIRGIVIGVLMLRLIFVGLNMVNVPQDLIYLVKGAIILFACALDMRKYLVKK
jgi:methyl-galactoside transport system permease protein